MYEDRYDLMQLGDKYGARIKGTQLYIDLDGKQWWLSPNNVMERCVHADKEMVKSAAEDYFELHDELENNILNAKEVKK